MTVRRDRILSIPVDRIAMAELVDEAATRARLGGAGRVCFANVHMLKTARSLPELRAALESSLFVAPDGAPVAALLSLSGPRQERVDGMGVFPRLLEAAARERLPVALYGDTPEVLAEVRAKAARELPDLGIVAAISPARGELPLPGETEHVRQLAASGARMVFVALGCPKQEIWMARHASEFPGIVFGVGNAFRTWIGMERRPPEWVRRAGMEWLSRLCQNPSRLWKRYLVSNAWFAFVAPWWLVRRRILPRRAAGGSRGPSDF